MNRKNRARQGTRIVLAAATLITLLAGSAGAEQKMTILNPAAALFSLFTGSPGAHNMTTYSGSSWRTLHSGKASINEFCAKRLGTSPQGSWDRCFLPRERIIACSETESCLQVAIDAANASYGSSGGRFNGPASSSASMLSIPRPSS